MRTIAAGAALLAGLSGSTSTQEVDLRPGPGPERPLTPPGALHQGHDPIARGVDVLHYDLRLALPREGRRIQGRTGILFETTVADLDRLALDFGPLTVDSVTVDGRAARFTHAAGRLEVALALEPVGRRAEAIVWYHGEPKDGLILQANRHGRPSVFADNWPDRARQWFPAVDHPWDKASVAFEVEAPAEWEVVANGLLRDVRDVGGGRERTR